MKDYVEIQYDKVQLALLIEGILKNPKHIKEVSSCIAETLLGTDTGVKNLILASKGLELSLKDYKLKIGGLIRLDVDRISSWRMNIPNMIEAQLILNNNLEARVTGFDRTKMDPIQVTYEAIDDNSKRFTEDYFVRLCAIV